MASRIRRPSATVSRVAGLGQLERLLVGIARGRPAVGGRPPVAAQARRPRLRAAVERLGGEAGAGEIAASSARNGAAPGCASRGASEAATRSAISGRPASHAHSTEARPA